mmetsp:Transcript_65490/g.161286  ORF Transcript_65490/g.161286 Transcript_65490/m.161286 type:complete len:142 (+) Transcript_65490:384-809(+)
MRKMFTGPCGTRLGILRLREGLCRQSLLYVDAHIQFRMPIAQGGFGVTANEAKASALFYCAMSHAFKFVAQSRYPPVIDFIRSDSFRNKPLYSQDRSVRREPAAGGRRRKLWRSGFRGGGGGGQLWALAACSPAPGSEREA